MAIEIRRRVREEIGLPISVGVARTKHLAKIASQVAKPDGLTVVDPESERAFLNDLPVELMWGVGPVAKTRLAASGIVTIGQLAASSPQSLVRLLGTAAGEKLGALARNRDPRKVVTRNRARSVGAQSALGRKPIRWRTIRPTLRHLADRVASRLRAKNRAGRTITVRVRFADMEIDHDKMLAAAPDGTPASKDFGDLIVSDCFIPQIVYSTTFGYRTDKVSSTPESVCAVFDTEKFPGKRALEKRPINNMEWALLCDGVAKDKVYDVLGTDEGVAQALAKLDTIKSDVIWWASGSETPQLLADGEIVMGSTGEETRSAHQNRAAYKTGSRQDLAPVEKHRFRRSARFGDLPSPEFLD